MSRQTMIEAADRLPRADLYGIGVYQLDGEFIEWNVEFGDVDRDTEWVLAKLREAGVADSDHVLITAGNHEGPWYGPIVRALREIGATYTPAETYAWDAGRFISAIERLPITVVIGMSGESAEAVASHVPDIAELLSEIRLIWARTDAYDRLIEEGVEAHLITAIGPALGFGQEAASRDVAVNGAEWKVAEGDSGLVVSAVGARDGRIAEAQTGVEGRVIATGEHTKVQIV